MKSKMTNAAILALGLSVVPSLVSAQTMQFTDKGYVSVNGGWQAASHTLDTSSTFTLYEENATVASSQKIKGGGFFDIGGAYRVWGKNLLAGVTFSHVTSDNGMSVTASIPDPAFHDRPRAVTTTVNSSKHVESAIHIDAIWMIPVAEKMDIGVFGGPTIFMINQDVAGTPVVTEPGPVVNVPLTEAKKTTAGINFGVDFQYLIGKKWGVGGVARYSWGSASLPGASDSLTVGGFQIGAGGRVRF